jgi:hypothetical protein
MLARGEVNVETAPPCCLPWMPHSSGQIAHSPLSGLMALLVEPTWAEKRPILPPQSVSVYLFNLLIFVRTLMRSPCCLCGPCRVKGEYTVSSSHNSLYYINSGNLLPHLNRDSPIGIGDCATGRGVGVRVPIGARCFFLSTLSRPVLGPTQTSIRWVPEPLSPVVSEPCVKQATRLQLMPKSRMKLYFHSPVRLHEPITMAARSKTGTVFARSNTGILGSNGNGRMDVCVCAILCVQVAALRPADPLPKEFTDCVKR